MTVDGSAFVFYRDVMSHGLNPAQVIKSRAEIRYLSTISRTTRNFRF